MIRAIYIGDIRYPECPVFEYNKKTGKFHMISDEETAYEEGIVLEDDDFLMFLVKEDRVRRIEKTKEKTKENISK